MKVGDKVACFHKSSKFQYWGIASIDEYNCEKEGLYQVRWIHIIDAPWPHETGTESPNWTLEELLKLPNQLII